VRAYLDASAVDEMADGFRLEQLAERTTVFVPWAQGPSHQPFFADMQRVRMSSQLLGQLQMLVFSLLARDELGEGLDGAPIDGVDAAWATDLMAELDSSRLSGLVVKDIAPPHPDLYDSTRNLTNVARMARMYGADERTERVALLIFEGDHYVVGFTLLRYGDTWRVAQQNSPFSQLSVYGTAQPTTPAAFAGLTAE
jgi:hypothetical protein